MKDCFSLCDCSLYDYICHLITKKGISCYQRLQQLSSVNIFRHFLTFVRNTNNLYIVKSVNRQRFKI